MKRTTNTGLLVVLVLIVLGACSTTVWDELPQKIATFVSEYFPGQGVKSYVEGTDSETVELRNSATLVFDSDYHWRVVDGNGAPLPAIFINDQVPPGLLQWLQEREAVGMVYKAERTSAVYILTLEDTYIEYDLATGQTHYRAV